MTEAQAAQAGWIGVIRTDAKVLGLAQWSYFQGPESGFDDSVDRNTANWNEALFSSVVDVAEPMHGQMRPCPLWETTFAESTWIKWPKNRKAETTYMYSGAIASMDEENVVSIYDMIGSEACIASDIGQRVYDTTKTAMSQGKKICLSFESISIISSAFLNSSIGQLYNGEFSDEEIEKNLRIANMSPDHVFLLERIKHRAKNYYKDPDRFERAIRMSPE